MGRAAHAHRERRARWALLRGDQAPHEAAAPETETVGRPARAAQERVTITADGTLTEKGRDPRVFLEIDGVQFFSLSGELLDAFTADAAGLATPPVGYTLQCCVLSTPTAAATAVARAFAGARPPTAALRDLCGRLQAWWEEYLAGEYVPTHRFLIVLSGPARSPQGATLARVAGEAERTLHRLGVPCRRLDAAAVRALRDEFPDPLADPAARETLDAVYTPGQGARSWARTFYIRVPATVTQPGWAAPLLAFPAPLRVALHVTGLDQDKERGRAKSRGRRLGDLVVGAGAQGREADVDTGDARSEARAQAKAMRTGGLAVVQAGLYVTVFAPDPASLDVRGDALWGLLTGAGAGALDTEAARARGAQGPLLQATRPLGLDPARHTYRLYAETVGNAWLAIARSPGTPTGLLIGRAADDGTLVHLDIADRSLKNRLIDVFGGSGQGKSFFVQKLMLWFLLWDAWATAVDTVGGYATLCAIAGGRTVRLGGPGTASVNIWDGPRATAEERAARLYFVGTAHEVLLAESGKAITGRVRSVIDAGVAAVYAGHRDTTEAGRNPDDTRRTAADPPLERDLVAWLEEQATRQADHEDRRLYKDVAAELAPYVRAGRYAPLVDRPTSFAVATRLLAFHIEPKQLRADTPIYAFVMFAMTDLADRRDALAQEWGRRSGRGTVQHLLAIDEGWSILRHQAGQEWVNGIGLTGRHSGMVPMFVSQKLSHLTSSPAASGYFDQTSLHFIFNMHDTNDESGTDLRQWIAGKLRLTEGEAARIGGLAGKQTADKTRLEYAQLFMIRTTKVASRPARGVVNVPSSPEEAWLFASDKDDKEVRARMVWAVATDPEDPTGGEVYQAVCLLAEGATPEEVHAARLTQTPVRDDRANGVDHTNGASGGAMLPATLPATLPLVLARACLPAPPNGDAIPTGTVTDDR